MAKSKKTPEGTIIIADAIIAKLEADKTELEGKIAVLEGEAAKEKKNPYENPPEGTIVLVRQSDGNWKGFTFKNRQIISERQYDPQIVLQLLITHG